MSDDSEVGTEPVLVPAERLSRQALSGLVDAYVLREGTDYGHEEIPLPDKRRAVQAQIHRGEVVIVFDPRTEQVELVLRRDLPAPLRGDDDPER
ncbi:MAG: YheU family protein [Sandaracinaceae bacterium]